MLSTCFSTFSEFSRISSSRDISRPHCAQVTGTFSSSSSYANWSDPHVGHSSGTDRSCLLVSMEPPSQSEGTPNVSQLSSRPNCGWTLAQRGGRSARTACSVCPTAVKCRQCRERPLPQPPSLAAEQCRSTPQSSPLREILRANIGTEPQLIPSLEQPLKPTCRLAVRNDHGVDELPAFSHVLEQAPIMTVVCQPNLHDPERREVEQVHAVGLVRTNAVRACPAQRR